MSRPTSHRADAPVADQASRLRALAERASRATPPTDVPEPKGNARPEAPPADRAPGRGALPSAPVVAVASGKGGVGKSTIAVNLAVALEPRRRTILVDADLGTANADVLCGLAPSRRLDLELFRARGPDLSSVMIETPLGFRLVPGAAGVANAATLDRQQRRLFTESLARLGEPGEIVLADLGAGIGAPVVECLGAADLGLVVTTPEPTALADAYALIKCVVRYRGEPRPLRMGLVVNQAESRSVARAAHDRIDRVCRRFLGGSMPLLGIVRRDRRATAAVRQRTPLVAGWPGAPASRDLRALSVMVAAVTPGVGCSRRGGGLP